jgi:hypothetical protein
MRSFLFINTLFISKIPSKLGKKYIEVLKKYTGVYKIYKIDK